MCDYEQNTGPNLNRSTTNHYLEDPNPNSEIPQNTTDHAMD